MANVIPPPLPPPPPPPQLLNFQQPPQQQSQQQPPQQQPPQQNQVAQAPVSKKPYITIKNLTTVVDQSIHRYVDEVKESLDLKELPVIGPSGTSKSTAAPKFERTQGDVPELKVDIYEQMVYHRAKSTNTNLLEIFVPTRYKINYDKIKQYFATKGGDKEVQDLINSVINAYGNNNNSLFYKHTIAGKTTGAGAGAAASRSRPGTSSGSDLDKLAKERIQNQIDNWHNKYAEWSFYDNASSFFIQNIKLEPDDLLTLKMDFDDIIAGAGAGAGASAGAGAGGLVTIIDEISGKYTALKAKYTDNIEVPDIARASTTLDTYNKLFERLYAEIDKRKTEPLDYVTERQRDFPSYTFDVNTRNYLLRAFERLHTISQEMKTFGDTPINSKIKLLETLYDEYTQLIQWIERDEKLKTANDIFTKYMLGPGRKGGFSNFIPNYKIIQYIFWLIRGGGDVANANFVNNAFEVNYADVNPEDLYGFIRDLPGLVGEDARKQAQFMKDEEIIKKLEDINTEIGVRKTQENRVPPPTQTLKTTQTNKINELIRGLSPQITTISSVTKDTLDSRTEEIKSKIRELKGKHFASMLIFYNYIQAKKANGMAEIAEFFNTFYEDSKLMNPEIDSHSSIVGDNPKTVPTFSFGIDILFWTLLRITKYYSDKHINFIKKMKEQIGPENPDLRNLRIEIGVKESKLKHICDLIAKTGEIPIDTIIPDRAGYYIKPGAAGAGADPLYTGFVNPDLYKEKWREKIDPAKNRDGTAAKVIYTANKMNKKLNASLGMTGAVADDAPKMAEMLSKLIELNTIQVVNMLFAKPRNIWYSPDLQMKGETDESSKWIVFQLDRNKIISGRAFKKFEQMLMKDPVAGGGGGTATTTRIQCILNKAWTTEVQPIVYKEKNTDPPAFLIFIIATEPRPRMLDKENVKDATDVMLDNPSFSGVVVSEPNSAGSTDIVSDNVIENGSNLSGAMTTALDKIKGKIIPTKESCATCSDAILNAGKDLNDSFKKTFKSIGIDLEQKVDKFLQNAPPPPPPAMIPPPLPPPPPSAVALATHQAGVQAGVQAAQQAAAVAAATTGSVAAAVAATAAAALAAANAQTASDQAQAYLAARPNLNANIAVVASAVAAAAAAVAAAAAAAASKSASDKTATATTLAQVLQLKQDAEKAMTDTETNKNEAITALKELTKAAFDAATQASRISLSQIQDTDGVITRASPLPTTVAELNRLRQDISNSLVATAKAVADTTEAIAAAHAATTTMTAVDTTKLQKLSDFLANRVLVKLTQQEQQLQNLHDHEIPNKIREVEAAVAAAAVAASAVAASAVAAVAAASAASAATASAAAAASAASASAAAAEYTQHLTEAVDAFRDIIDQASLPAAIADFMIDTQANTAKFKEVAQDVVNALFTGIQPKIDEYNTDQYKEDIVGAGKQIDEAELQQLESAAAVCQPNIDVSGVRASFNEIGFTLAEMAPRMDPLLDPLKEKAQEIIDSITNDTTDPANSTKFSELKDKCVKIAKTYQDTKEDSVRVKSLVDDVLVGQYRELFDTKQQEVLDNIRTQITELAVSELPDGIDEGQGLLGQIEELLASVN